MLVSIVTPIYNGKQFLAQTVASVVAQTYRQWELILVDDGSPDDSYAVAQQLASTDPRITAVSKQNSGVAGARSYGYKRTNAASNFLVFLDQDDVWNPNFLETMIDWLICSPMCPAAHCQVLRTSNPCSKEGDIFPSSRNKVVERRIILCPTTEPTSFDVLICDNWVPTPGSVLLRREAFEKSRWPDGTYFDPAMGTADDWDMWLRLSLIGDLKFVVQPLISWRVHSSNNSSNIFYAYQSEIAVRKKYASSALLNDNQRAAAIYRYRKACCSANLVQILHFLRSSTRAIVRLQFATAVSDLLKLLRRTVTYVSLRFSLNASSKLPDFPDAVATQRRWPPV